jgi:hypothetical protein
MTRHKYSTLEIERKKGVDGLVGLVQRMVDESGNPVGFDASKWVEEWLAQPVPALGGKAPSKYMHSASGRKTIASLLAQAQSGAYA